VCDQKRASGLLYVRMCLLVCLCGGVESERENDQGVSRSERATREYVHQRIYTQLCMHLYIYTGSIKVAESDKRGRT